MIAPTPARGAKRWGRRLVAAALAAWLAMLASMGQAGANGVPQLVKLTYVDGLSTWGPRDAEGVLEFSFAEGFVQLDVTGLPRLVGQAYEGWLVRSATNEAISVGQFNTADSGSTHYEANLPPITDYSLDLFIVTVQSLEMPSSTPSQSRSVGGFFSVVQAPDAAAAGSEVGPAAAGGSSGSPAAAGPGAETPAAGAAPAQLPATGDPGAFLRNARGLTLIVLGGLALVFVTLRTRRRIRRERLP